MGPMGTLTVTCGAEPLRGCVEAARPLIDAATGAAMPAPEPLAAPDIVPLPPVPPAAEGAPDVPLPDDAAAGATPPLPESLDGDAGETAGGPPIQTLPEGLPGPNEETPVIDGLEGGPEPAPAN